MAVSTVAVSTRDFNFGVDLAGGMLVMVRFVNPSDLDARRRALADQVVDTSKDVL
jgi:hypothetical protein